MLFVPTRNKRGDAKWWAEKRCPPYTANAYGDIERGDSDPKLSKLQKIAETLEMDLSELLDLNDKTVLNINFTKQGKHYNVYMSSNSELEKQKFICEFKDKEIEMYKQKIADLTKLIDVLEKIKPSDL